MDAQHTHMTTRDGVRVTRTATPFDPAELGRVAELVDTPATRGMIAKVAHLVKIVGEK